MNYRVRFAPSAEKDLERLADFRINRAETIEELEGIALSMQSLRDRIHTLLSMSPFSFRKTGASPLRRELVVPQGATGYIARFEIRGDVVYILAVRHQRESDYH